jgi:hypothetical protein
MGFEKVDPTTTVHINFMYQLDGLPILHWRNKSGHQLAAPTALGNPAKECVWLSHGLP